MAEAFGEAIQRAELEDPEVTVFLAERGRESVGYVDAARGTRAVLCARRRAQSRSRGCTPASADRRRRRREPDAARLDEAAGRGKDAVWLGVWERNARAIHFYAPWGFPDVGSQPFLLGADLQTDLVMVRRMPRSLTCGTP